MIEFVSVEGGRFEVYDGNAILVAEQCAHVVQRYEPGRDQLTVSVDAEQLGECAKRLAARKYKFAVT